MRLFFPLQAKYGAFLWEIFLGVFFGGIFLISFNHLPFGHYTDDIKWVLLAESFLKGSVQTAWSLFPLPDTNITWGFGFLLSPVVALFGRNPIALKLFSSVCMLLGTSFFYFSVRNKLDAAGRVLFLLGFGGTSYSLSFSGSVVSEAGYMLFFGIFVFLIRRWGSLFSSKRQYFLAGLLSGALVVMRSIGFLVPFSVVGLGRSFFLRKQILFFILGAVFAAGPVFFIIKHLSGTASFYIPYWSLGLESNLTQTLIRFFQNIFYYWKGFSCLTIIDLAAVLPPNLFVKMFFVLLMALTVGRGIWCWRFDPVGRFLSVYFLGYIFILGAWNYQAPRYAFPLFPVFLALLGAGVEGLIRSPVSKGIFSIFILGGAVSNAPAVIKTVAQSMSGPAVISHESAKWLAENTPPEDPVVSMDIARIYFFTGRRGVPFVPSSDLASFLAGAHQLGNPIFFLKESNFVPAAPGIVDPIQQQFELLRAYLFNTTYFTAVYHNEREQVTVFRLRHF